MEPLLSLNGHLPYTAPELSTLFTPASRDSAAARAKGKQRPVELLPDRVDANEETSRPHAPRAQNPADGSEAAQVGLPVTAESTAQSDVGIPRAGDVDLSLAGVTAQNVGITYRLYPELAVSFQTQVVDRSTEETLRSIPTDARIELAQRYQQHVTVPLGHAIDTLA